MQFKTQIVVTGAKRSKGDFDGTAYDSTKIYTSTGLDTSKGDAVGEAGSEYAWGLSDNFNKIASLSFPFQAEATMEIVSNGKSNKTIMLDLKPVQQAK
jgi:hypothetical protein